MSVITQATLYLLATPLGNLSDASPRLVSVLKECDLICAEDTRVVAKLLAGLNIHGKKVLSIRSHNEVRQANKLAQQYPQAALAYVSDAGTPAISDPGAKLVAILQQHGFTITPIPGPSAVATALSVAGFVADGFVSGGFLPRATKAWTTRMTELAALGLPIVFFEAPTRIQTTLKRLRATFTADTPICLCRELTKLHEQIVHGSVGQIITQFEQGKIKAKGEFTLVIQPPKQPSKVNLDALQVANLLAQELPPTKAAKLTAKLTGADARTIYSQLTK